MEQAGLAVTEPQSATGTVLPGKKTKVGKEVVPEKSEGQQSNGLKASTAGVAEEVIELGRPL